MQCSEGPECSRVLAEGGDGQCLATLYYSNYSNYSIVYRTTIASVSCHHLNSHNLAITHGGMAQGAEQWTTLLHTIHTSLLPTHLLPTPPSTPSTLTTTQLLLFFTPPHLLHQRCHFSGKCDPAKATRRSDPLNTQTPRSVQP